METDDLLHRAGEEPEGVRVSQVSLDGERQPGDVRERSDRGGRETTLVYTRPIERHAVVGAGHDGLQPLQLYPSQLGARQVVRRADRVEPARRVVPCAHGVPPDGEVTVLRLR